MSTQQILFENTDISIIHRDGKVWLTLTDVARCLYRISETDKMSGLDKNTSSLDDAKRSVERIFKKKKAMIEARGDTQIIKFKEGNLYRSYRILSRSGLYAIAFAAQTSKAEAFQNFVLNLLEKHDNGQQPSKPVFDQDIRATLQSVHDMTDLATDKVNAYHYLGMAQDFLSSGESSDDITILDKMKHKMHQDITNMLIMNAVQVQLILEDDPFKTGEKNDFGNTTRRLG